MPVELPPTALDALGRGPRWRRLWLHRSTLLATTAGDIVRRVADLAVTLPLVVVTAPLALAGALAAAVRGRPALTRRPYLGRFLQPIELGELGAPGPLRSLPRLWAVLRGDLALVGPRPLPASEAVRLTAADLPRFQVRPGLADLFGVRAAANVAFEGRQSADAEQIHTSTVAGDLGLLLRSIPAAVIGGRVAAPPPELDLLGVRVQNWTMPQAVRWILDGGEGTRAVAFVNPDSLNKAWELPDYRAILGRCELVLPDGIGIHYACRMLGTALAANVNGTDLFPRLCDALAERAGSVFLLGAKPGVTDALVERLAENWPRLRVAGHAHGYFPRGGEQEEALVERIRTSGADVLLVAFGVPHQERWIDAWRERLGVRVAMGVGGLFDFYSGRVRRAPGWIRELGLEWAWRLLQEPGRMWRRYVIGNPLFLWRVWRWSRPGGATPG